MKFWKIFFCLLVAIIPLNAYAGDSIPSPVRVPDGKYIYVPDSLQDDVIRLLDGHSKAATNLIVSILTSSLSIREIRCRWC